MRNLSIFGWQDLFFGLLWLAITCAIVIVYTKRLHKDDPLRKAALPAFGLSIFGGVSVGLIYAFYYGGGDTYSYHFTAQGIAEAFFVDFRIWWKLISSSGKEVATADQQLFQPFKRAIWRVDTVGEQNYFTIKIYSFLEILTFGSYFGTSFIISTISFFSRISLLRVLYKYFPNAKQGLLIACLYMPSVWFWGSGILKDSITLSCAALMLVSFYNIFFNKKYIIFSILLFLICFISTSIIKGYIAYAFVPFLFLWLMLYIQKDINNPLLRITIGPIVSLSIGIIFIFAFLSITSGAGRYSPDNVLNQTVTNYKDLTSAYYYDDGKGSSYDLGTLEPTVPSLLSKLPLATITTYFRPFPWEVRSIIMVFAAAESLFVLLLFLWMLYNLSVPKFFKLFSSYPIVYLLILFPIFFGFMIGLTSGNFGNLTRYKIPAMPFFIGLLYIMLAYANRFKPVVSSTTTQ